MLKYSSHLVRTQILDLLRAWGMPEPAAQTTAEIMTDTDSSGIDSHGISMLMMYEALINAGKIDLTAAPCVVREGPSFASIDARNGIGHPAAVRAMRYAMDKASTSGIAAVTVYNSHHFGAAGYYARLAANCGMLGIVTSTTRTPVVIPTGGRQPVLGTNPLAFAAPVAGGEPYVLDMSTSIVAMNKVKAKALAGTALPEGWVVDPKGQPLTDAGAAFKVLTQDGFGGLAPLGGPGTDLGGHKGFGLGLMVQILSTALSGSPAPGHSGEHDQIGHVFIALNPAVFNPAGSAGEDIATLIHDVRHSAPLDPQSQIVIPGEPELEARGLRAQQGIPLPDKLRDLISEICARAGTPFLLSADAAMSKDGSAPRSSSPVDLAVPVASAPL